MTKTWSNEYERTLELDDRKWYYVGVIVSKSTRHRHLKPQQAHNIRKGISMLQVEMKDNESLEGLIRRFNKKVTQAGLLSAARRRKYFEKPVSKREARAIAIRKAARKELKAREFMTIRG